MDEEYYSRSLIFCPRRTRDPLSLNKLTFFWILNRSKQTFICVFRNKLCWWISDFLSQPFTQLLTMDKPQINNKPPVVDPANQLVGRNFGGYGDYGSQQLAIKYFYTGQVNTKTFIQFDFIRRGTFSHYLQHCHSNPGTEG